MTKRLALILFPLLLLAVACGSSGSDGASGGSDGSTAPTSADDGGASGGGCADEEGKAGVLRTFCDGDGTATVTVGDTEHEIAGGSCETGGGYFSFNAGVVATGEYEGTRPDYAGFALPEAEGDFGDEGVAATATFDGESVAIAQIDGTHDATSGTLDGVDLATDAPVHVEFTC
ncbi:MAG TPA: hypothetical protein P5254_17815 [Aquihabitans sp.]|nr:hypothetical protein [Aquihabitans sp.]